MTNLTKLIKELHEKQVTPLVMDMSWINKPNYRDNLDNLVTQTATEAYRQALLDLRKGLQKPLTLDLDAMERYDVTYDYIEGTNDALQTVRAQIEELLGKINEA